VPFLLHTRGPTAMDTPRSITWPTWPRRFAALERLPECPGENGFFPEWRAPNGKCFGWLSVLPLSSIFNFSQGQKLHEWSSLIHSENSFYPMIKFSILCWFCCCKNSNLTDAILPSLRLDIGLESFLSVEEMSYN